MIDTKYLAAVQKLQSLGYEFKYDEWSPKKSECGCHLDLEPGQKPDGCVLDENKPEHCQLAKGLRQNSKSKLDYPEWKPIVINLK